MKRLILILAILMINMQSFAQWTQFVWDTITFEETYEYLEIDTSNQNIWQIGDPDKIFFDSAFSTPNAIVTDTLSFYPINNSSQFYIKIGEFNYEGFYPYDIFIEIKHKYDTDTLKDGGYISVSYDYGLTWMNIIRDTVYEEVTPPGASENLYTESDTLFNGDFGFSGNSGGWVTTMFAWHGIPVDALNEIGDTMFIGFNFISDSFDTFKEGWMIDNIKLFSVDLGGGVKERINLNYNLYPNPTSNTLYMSSDKELSGSEIKIYNQLGQLLINTTLAGNSVSVSDLLDGIYFLGLLTDQGEIRKKFIIKN